MIWWVPIAQAVTPQQMTISMGVDQTDIQSQSYNGDSNANSIETALGVISPTEGSDFTHLFTGTVGVSPEPGTDLGSYGTTNDETSLTLSLMVPAGMNAMTFDFYFLSAEYPEFVGQVYNDTFEANINGSAWSGNAAVDSLGNVVGVNSAFFSVTAQSDLSGSGYDNGVGGGTGWLSVIVPVAEGELVSVEFKVYDVYDGIYDSAVLLDNFQWSEAEVEEPSIIVPINIDYLSPKRGDIDGGNTTVINGSNFDSSCAAFFDGTAAVSTTLLTDDQLAVITPPHAVGLVDVEVDCAGAQDVLVGGYTYYIEDAQADPPSIESVDPYRVDVAGGQEVTMTGAGFQNAVSVLVDGQTVTSTVLDTSTLTFTTPAHDEGLVNIQVINPDGLSDERYGALLFSATETDSSSGSTDDTASSQETDAANDTGLDGESDKAEESGCASAPILPLLLLSMLGWRRKR